MLKNKVLDKIQIKRSENSKDLKQLVMKVKETNALKVQKERGKGCKSIVIN